MNKTQKEFFSLSVKHKALLIGDFTLKSGKKSPYFFNIASLLEGGCLHELSAMFANTIKDLNGEFDVIFGPAYKGIPLASALATKLGGLNSQSYPVCFDRKEEKTHGEGGSLIGSVKDKRVIVVDDVLTAGTALKNSINLVQQEGGFVVAAAVALDREEKEGHLTIRKSLEKELHIPIKAVASISNLLSFLEAEEGLTKEANLIKNYLSKN